MWSCFKIFSWPSSSLKLYKWLSAGSREEKAAILILLFLLISSIKWREFQSPAFIFIMGLHQKGGHEDQAMAALDSAAELNDLLDTWRREDQANISPVTTLKGLVFSFLKTSVTPRTWFYTCVLFSVKLRSLLGIFTLTLLCDLFFCCNSNYGKPSWRSMVSRVFIRG